MKVDLEPAVVHVIDDDDMVRNALTRLLSAAGYVVRSYQSAGDYLLGAPDERTGCLVLDVHMPGRDGFALQESMRWHPEYARPIIFLSGYAEVAASVRAIKAGACDFLLKPVDSPSLLAAVRAALQRDGQVRGARLRQRTLERQCAGLTPRERTVLAGVVRGKLNKQIAFELGVTERTVKSDRSTVFHAFGIRTLSELMAIADDLALVSDANAEAAQALPFDRQRETEPGIALRS